MDITDFINTEFYNSPSGEVMIKTEGKAVKVLDESSKDSREFIQNFLEYIIVFYNEAYKALAEYYSKSQLNKYHYEYKIVSRFIRCNFGEYDALHTDIDENGTFSFEEVHCPLRGECKLENICCKAKFTTKLTFRETEILKLFVKHYSVDEIAEKLFISPYTVSNHLKNIHSKTNTHSIAELVSYWNDHDLK